MFKWQFGTQFNNATLMRKTGNQTKELIKFKVEFLSTF
jgi:hypothetical protein